MMMLWVCAMVAVPRAMGAAAGVGADVSNGCFSGISPVPEASAYLGAGHFL
jgi:hypothetical protein